MDKNIAVIVASHKEASKALLESAEMICGKQDNVSAVCFYEDMDNEKLIQQMENQIKKMKYEDGLLFLTDLYGGTPFKTAFMLSQKYKNSYVVSGFNLPMLLEVLLGKNMYSVEELYNKSKSSGKEGIRSYEATVFQEDDE